MDRSRMGEGAHSGIIIGTSVHKLEVGKRYHDVILSDHTGQDHDMSVFIVREATEQEYRDGILAVGGRIRAHGPYYYAMAVD